MDICRRDMEKDSVLGKYNGFFSISKKDKIIRDIAWKWMEKKSIMLKKETRLKRHEQSLDIEYIMFGKRKRTIEVWTRESNEVMNMKSNS